jgi:hypothetical protein
VQKVGRVIDRRIRRELMDARVRLLVAMDAMLGRKYCAFGERHCGGITVEDSARPNRSAKIRVAESNCHDSQSGGRGQFHGAIAFRRDSENNFAVLCVRGYKRIPPYRRNRKL